jgi:hypothetical protein
VPPFHSVPCRRCTCLVCGNGALRATHRCTDIARSTMSSCPEPHATLATLRDPALHCATLSTMDTKPARHCATLRYTVRHCATLCYTVRYCATLRHTARLCATLCDTVRHCATLSRATLRDTVRPCATLCDTNRLRPEELRRPRPRDPKTSEITVSHALQPDKTQGKWPRDPKNLEDFSVAHQRAR